MVYSSAGSTFDGVESLDWPRLAGMKQTWLIANANSCRYPNSERGGGSLPLSVENGVTGTRRRTIKEGPGAGVGRYSKNGKIQKYTSRGNEVYKNLIKRGGWRRNGTWLSILLCRDHGAVFELNKQKTGLRKQITVLEYSSCSRSGRAT